MEIRSLAYRTDLFFPRFEGFVLDRGEYTVIRTPSNPDFFWGNFLLFSAPPAEGDFERWSALFREEISAHQPAIHMAFGWDSPEGQPGEIGPFLEAGFEQVDGLVLSAGREHIQAPPKYHHEVVVRPLDSDEDWDMALAAQMECRPSVFTYEEYLPFKRAKMARYREMQRAGLGAWFGAFLGQQLAADLGLFCVDGIGRFQSVETVPEFRRRGICGALVHQAALWGFERMGAHTLVMVAEEHYHAARIYESAGFRFTERQIGLQYWKGEG